MRDSWLEFRILWQTLTLRKVWNWFCVCFSFYLSKLLGRPYHRGLPVSLGIEPTTACNLRCPQCPSGLRSFSRPTGRLSLKLFTQIIDEVGADLTYLILYFQGEPYLNPDFLKMVRYAATRKIFTMTSTNAHFLTPAIAEETVLSGLHRIIISLDGVDQQSYAQYRVGGKLETVLAGVRNLVAAKKKYRTKTPIVDIQFIVFSHNEHQLQAVRQLFAELEADRLLIKTAQIYDFETGNALIPTNVNLSRYQKKNDGKYQIKNKLRNQCWKLWLGAEITWDGRVLPCCFDKDATYEMGKLPEVSFKEVWRAKKYQDFRQQLLKGRKNIAICRNCSEGTQIRGSLSSI
jgi:radical SAM protein with 4Fe4S-binding SPASM domain